MLKDDILKNDETLIRIIECYQVNQVYPQLMKILGEPLKCRVVKYNGMLVLGNPVFEIPVTDLKTEEEYIEIIKNLTADQSNKKNLLCAAALLFEYVCRMTENAIKELFHCLNYVDPCGKYTMTAGKRLCVSILEQICEQQKNTNPLVEDVSHILLRRIYDIEYIDGIFDGFLNEETLMERRKKHKLCFVIADDDVDLSFLSNFSDVTITGIFLMEKTGFWQKLKGRFITKTLPEINVILRKEWISPNMRIKNDFIHPDEILHLLKKPVENSARPYLSVERIPQDFPLSSLVKDYHTIEQSDFCITYTKNKIML